MDNEEKAFDPEKFHTGGGTYKVGCFSWAILCAAGPYFAYIVKKHMKIPSEDDAPWVLLLDSDGKIKEAIQEAIQEVKVDYAGEDKEQRKKQCNDAERALSSSTDGHTKVIAEALGSLITWFGFDGCFTTNALNKFKQEILSARQEFALYMKIYKEFERVILDQQDYTRLDSIINSVSVGIANDPCFNKITDVDAKLSWIKRELYMMVQSRERADLYRDYLISLVDIGFMEKTGFSKRRSYSRKELVTMLWDIDGVQENKTISSLKEKDNNPYFPAPLYTSDITRGLLLFDRIVSKIPDGKEWTEIYTNKVTKYYKLEVQRLKEDGRRYPECFYTPFHLIADKTAGQDYSSLEDVDYVVEMTKLKAYFVRDYFGW